MENVTFLCISDVTSSVFQFGLYRTGRQPRTPLFCSACTCQLHCTLRRTCMLHAVRAQRGLAGASWASTRSRFATTNYLDRQRVAILSEEHTEKSFPCFLTKYLSFSLFPCQLFKTLRGLAEIQGISQKMWYKIIKWRKQQNLCEKFRNFGNLEEMLRTLGKRWEL